MLKVCCRTDICSCILSAEKCSFSTIVYWYRAWLNARAQYGKWNTIVPSPPHARSMDSANAFFGVKGVEFTISECWRLIPFVCVNIFRSCLFSLKHSTARACVSFLFDTIWLFCIPHTRFIIARNECAPAVSHINSLFRCSVALMQTFGCERHFDSASWLVTRKCVKIKFATFLARLLIETDEERAGGRWSRLKSLGMFLRCSMNWILQHKCWESQFMCFTLQCANIMNIQQKKKTNSKRTKFPNGQSECKKSHVSHPTHWKSVILFAYLNWAVELKRFNDLFRVMWMGQSPNKRREMNMKKWVRQRLRDVQLTWRLLFRFKRDERTKNCIFAQPLHKLLW